MINRLGSIWRRDESHGFTLIELMAVVSIIGLIAAIAIPLFVRHLRESKTSEAFLQLKILSESASSYYQVDHYDENGLPYEILMFPTSTGGITDTTESFVPATVPPGGKVDSSSDWVGSPWEDLKYFVAKPHYYQYRYQPDNVLEATFTAKACGDLDGDGVTSLWRVEGVGNEDSVTLTPVIPDSANPYE
ncbi:MAG: prepilin-type N-terminal cleavage/methylation domain-containing protein [Myxococcota bacterium]